MRDPLAFRLPLLFAGVFLLAFAMRNGILEEKWHRVSLAPLIGLGVGLVMSFTPRGWLWRGFLGLVLGAAVGWATHGVFHADDPLLVRIIPAVGSFLMFIALEPLAVRRIGAVVPASLAAASITTAVLILWSGQIGLAIPVGAMGAALAVAAVFALIRRQFTLADGSIAAIVPTLVVAADIRWTYLASEVLSISPAWAIAFALAVASPLAGWIVALRPLRVRLRLGSAVALIIVAAVCIGAVLIIALDPFIASEVDPYEQMYLDMMGGG